MTARQSYPVTLALRMVKRGISVTQAAAHHKVNVSSVRRALRRDGVPPLPRGRRKQGVNK